MSMPNDGTTAIPVSPISENEMRSLLTAFNDTVNDLITRIVALSEQAKAVESLRNKVSQLSDRITQAEANNDSLRHDLEVERSNYTDAQKAADHWQGEHSAAVKSITQAWNAHDERARERDEARTALSAANSRVTDLEGQLAMVKSDLEHAWKAHDARVDERDGARADRDSLADQLQRANETIRQLQQAVDEEKRVNQGLVQNNDQAHTELDRVTKDRDDWKNSFYTIKDELSEANRKIEAAKAAHEQMTAAMEKVKAAFAVVTENVQPTNEPWASVA